MKFDFSNEGSKSRYLIAALTLFAERGYDLVSVRDISKEAGTSEAALYKHFKSKEEMALYLFRLILKRYTAEIGMIARNDSLSIIERLQEMQRYTYDLYHADSASVQFALLSQYQFWTTVEDELKPHFWMQQLLAEGIASDEIDSRFSLATLTSLYTGMILEPLIQYQYFQEEHPSWIQFREEVSYSIKKLLMKN
ncbi:TetR/AcrR family transcriptional regulator [Ignatzschineria indica]|uniref:TetR/AcrR family transcriptional regulator n=1 Tax=Ignatzschineria indica TaxID=472583 RepID=UPI002576D160|nr:TetR/AcrR family transcriptional regulator [Ignatzschineria indica]MDM1544554.1 TetR/AcrR family transcriptional regulator [Ignatzschineria indica]